MGKEEAGALFKYTFIPGPILYRKNSAINFCFACFRQFDWLLKKFEPIRMLKTSVM